MAGTFYCQWHITDRCNLSCKHCYQNAVEHYSDVDYEKLCEIADQLCRACEKWNVELEVSLTGGEPLVRKDELFSLLDYLNKRDVVTRLDVMSNGLLITDEIAKRLKQISKLYAVQVSLESPDRNTHDEIRGRGAFDRAVKALELLKKHGLKTNVMMTLSKLNYKDVCGMWNLLNSIGVDHWAVDRFIPEQQDVYGFNDNTLTKENLKEAFEAVRRLHIEKEGISPKIFSKRALFCLVGEEGATCSAGGSTLTILPNGDVLPCRRLPIKLGNVFQDGIFKIWYTSEILWKLRNTNELNSKCRSCEYLSRCKGCRAMAYAVSGDYMGEDVLCWKD